MYVGKQPPFPGSLHTSCVCAFTIERVRWHVERSALRVERSAAATSAAKAALGRSNMPALVPRESRVRFK